MLFLFGNGFTSRELEVILELWDEFVWPNSPPLARINPDNHKSSVRWGKGEVKDKKFKYTYTESLNIKGNEKFSTFNTKLLFEGMRSFDVDLNNNEIKMVSENKNQVWTINEKGMVYNDKEWGEDKIFVERKWKRLTPIKWLIIKRRFIKLTH